ncbi:hypothetical protein S245_005787 [Arachis hypogaea]
MRILCESSSQHRSNRDVQCLHRSRQQHWNDASAGFGAAIHVGDTNSCRSRMFGRVRSDGGSSGEGVGARRRSAIIPVSGYMSRRNRTRLQRNDIQIHIPSHLKGDKGPFGSLASLLQVPMVHVDDVARAHIFLLEHPNPKGRYNCSSSLVTVETISQVVSSKYPEFQLLTLDKLKQTEGAKLQNLSSKKLIDAGFVFKYGLEEMVDDAIRCCKEKGYM